MQQQESLACAGLGMMLGAHPGPQVEVVSPALDAPSACGAMAAPGVGDSQKCALLQRDQEGLARRRGARARIMCIISTTQLHEPEPSPDDVPEPDERDALK